MPHFLDCSIGGAAREWFRCRQSACLPRTLTGGVRADAMEFDQDTVSDHKLDFTTIQDMVNTHVFGEGAPSHTRAARPSRGRQRQL